jgi:hypothetical protein
MSGAQIIRSALFQRSRKGNLGHIAQSLGCQVSILEDWANNRTKTIPPELLGRVCKQVFQNGSAYDPVTDEVVTGGSVRTHRLPSYPPVTGDPNFKKEYVGLPQATAVKPPPSRPGWLGGWR